MALPSNVYVVDDDPSVRRALGRVLRGAGLNCRAFASGEEFLTHVLPSSSGCLVLDISMPDMTGHELLARMKTLGYSLPVIVLSAFDAPENRQRSRELGAINFFHKPVDSQALLDAIQWAAGTTPQTQ